MSMQLRDFGWDLDRSFRAFDELRREMDRLFDGHVRRLGHPLAGHAYPRVSTHEDGDVLVVRAEVPGFEKDKLEVTLEQGTLTLRGERRVEAPEGYAVHRQERAPMRFARTFALPVHVDVDNVTATLKNGVLELRLPKAAEARARQIEVRAA